MKTAIVVLTVGYLVGGSVCADLTGKDKKSYDVDFFVNLDAYDAWQVASTMIHKVDGVERYAWVEERAVWKQVAPPQK